MINQNKIKEGAELIIEGLGVDKENVNFKDTPNRVARAYAELCAGLEDPTFKVTSFPTSYKGMVIVDPIRTIGLCPHHLLPIEFEVYVGYIPDGTAIGLSKIPRVVEHLAHQPMMQEDLTEQIVIRLGMLLNDPQGIICVVKGKHSCMRIRGVRQADGMMITSAFTGNFEQLTTRQEFMNLIK